ncbi:hypothetical protein H0A73_11045 [Alcaligenaceae bacterium]|nr:hypothetical protein [Alcaligenaceae bacterium]
MTDKSTHRDGTTPPRQLGRELLSAFTYQNATISKSELTSKHAAKGVTEHDLNEAIEWLKSEQLIEPADERGRIRLSPQGRSTWRNLMGHA